MHQTLMCITLSEAALTWASSQATSADAVYNDSHRCVHTSLQMQCVGIAVELDWEQGSRE